MRTTRQRLAALVVASCTPFAAPFHVASAIDGAWATGIERIPPNPIGFISGKPIYPVAGGDTTDTYNNQNVAWVAPSIAVNGFDVTSVTIECWGKGGNGGASNGIAGGGAGGGGAYSKRTPFTVTPGTSYRVNAPGNGGGSVTGDAWFSTTGNVAPTSTAEGCLAQNGVVGTSTSGQGSTQGAGGAGGAAASGFGDTKHSGGNGGGGAALTTNGGGGGGSAGDTSNGGNGASAGTAGTAGTTNGATGATGATAAAVATTPTAPGGGGGGASTLKALSNGANGRVSITYGRIYYRAFGSGQPYIVATSATATGGFNATGVTVTMPTKTSTIPGVEDWAVAVIAGSTNNATPAITAPAGWTEICHAIRTTSNIARPGVWAYKRKLDGTEAASYTWTGSAGAAANRACGVIYIVRGASDVDVSTSVGTTGTNTLAIPNSATTTSAKDLVFVCSAIADTTSGVTVNTATPASGWTEQSDFGSTAGAPTTTETSLTVDTQVQDAAGATATPTITWANTPTTGAWVACAFAMNPVSPESLSASLGARTAAPAALTASLSLTAAISHLVSKFLAASLSITSSVVKLANPALSKQANLSLTVAETKTVAPTAKTGSLSLSSTYSRAVTAARSFAANLSLTTAIQRLTSKFFSGNLSLSSVVDRTLALGQSFMANLSPSSTASKDIAPGSLSANVSLSSTLSRLFVGARSFTASLSLSAVVQRLTSKFFATDLSLSSVVDRALTLARAFTASVGLSSSATKDIAPSAFTSDLSLSSTFSRLLTAARAFTADLFLDTAVQRSITKFLSTDLSLSAAVERLIAAARSFATSLGLFSSVTKDTAPAPMTGSLDLSAIYDRAITAFRSFVANLSLDAVFERQVATIFEANLTLSAAMSKFSTLARSFTTNLVLTTKMFVTIAQDTLDRIGGGATVIVKKVKRWFPIFDE